MNIDKKNEISKLEEIKVYEKNIEGDKILISVSQDEITNISLNWKDLDYYFVNNINGFPNYFYEKLSQYNPNISISDIKKWVDFIDNDFESILIFMKKCIEESYLETKTKKEKIDFICRILTTPYFFFWVINDLVCVKDISCIENYIRFFLEKIEILWNKYFKYLSPYINDDLPNILIWDNFHILNKPVFWIEKIDNISQEELYLRFRENYMKTRQKWKMSRKIFSIFCNKISREHFSSDSNKKFFDYRYIRTSSKSGKFSYLNWFSYEILDSSPTLDTYKAKITNLLLEKYLALFDDFSNEWKKGFFIYNEMIKFYDSIEWTEIESFSRQELEKIIYSITTLSIERWDKSLLRLENCFQAFDQKNFFLELEDKNLNKNNFFYRLKDDNKKIRTSLSNVSKNENIFNKNQISIKNHILDLVEGFKNIDNSFQGNILQYHKTKEILTLLEENLDKLSNQDLTYITYKISLQKNSVLPYLFFTEFPLYPEIFRIIFFWERNISNMSFEEIFYTFQEDLKNPILSCIFERIGEIAKIYKWTYNNYYGIFGFILFSFIKDRKTIQNWNFDDFLKNLFYQLIDSWYIFFKDWEELIIFELFKSKSDFLKSVINENISKLIKSNKDKLSLFLWSDNSKISGGLLEYFDSKDNFSYIVSKDDNKLSQKPFLDFFIDFMKKSRKGLYNLDWGYQWIFTTKPNHTQDTLDIKIFETLKKDNIFEKIIWNFSYWKNKLNSLSHWFESYFPIWWKLHFSSPLEKEKISNLQSLFGFSSTPFKLIHSDTSLNLPPCSSPLQLIEVFYKLKDIGILDDEKIEAQLSIAWRLPNFLSWILGSLMIFLKNYQISYPEKSFHTWNWNNITDTCIMCYDAWVLDKKDFPVLWDHINGRTDILWIRRIEEVFSYFIIWNLVSQSHYGWKYSDIWKDFVKNYIKLLESNDIKDILNSKWVHNPDISHSEQWSYLEHAKTVNRVTTILNNDISNLINSGYREGFIFDVRDMVKEILEQNNILQGFDSSLNQFKREIPLLEQLR